VEDSLVTDDEIKSAMFVLLERAKLLVEPSGAVPLAAILNAKIKGLIKILGSLGTSGEHRPCCSKQFLPA
jgi:threonine dehydratase